MDTALYELNGYNSEGALSPEDLEKLREAAAILRDGGLVAFPTETVYGLGGNALMKDASRRIYAAKGRPSDNPLIVHITEFEDIEPLVSVYSDEARKLAEAFWPGPFTLIMPKSELVPHETTGGLDTVALRMPSHPVARELIRLAGVPVAAPSANTSGRPSTTTAAHCMEDLKGRVEAVVDGGSCTIGLESTIVDVSGEEPVLLRPGAVTREMLREALGRDIAVDPAVKKPLEKDEHPKAPGMKYRHYAPKAPMIIIEAEAGEGADRESRTAERMIELALRERSEGRKLGLIASSEVCGLVLEALSEEGTGAPESRRLGSLHIYDTESMVIMDLGRSTQEKSWAHELFAALREMDEEDVDRILAEGVDENDIGFAVMNRLRKAAGGNVIKA